MQSCPLLFLANCELVFPATMAPQPSKAPAPTHWVPAIPRPPPGSTRTDLAPYQAIRGPTCPRCQPQSCLARRPSATGSTSLPLRYSAAPSAFFPQHSYRRSGAEITPPCSRSCRSAIGTKRKCFKASVVLKSRAFRLRGAGISNEINIDLAAGVGQVSQVALSLVKPQFGIRLTSKLIHNRRGAVTNNLTFA